MCKKIAVLIDAENISARDAGIILQKIERIGSVVICRAYADWSLAHTKSWQEYVRQNPVKPVQCFHEGKAKEVVDKQIIMDSVEVVLQNPNINSFCLVSSDQGYADLILKIHSMGKFVLGFGEKLKTKLDSRFVRAFDEFFFVEDLRESFKAESPESAENENRTETDAEFLERVFSELEEKSREKNSVFYSSLAKKIQETRPELKRKKLTEWIKQFSGKFELSGRYLLRKF
jgi:hypothetical protein